LPEQPPLDDRVPADQSIDQGAPDAISSREQALHDGLTHTQLAELIGAAFGDEAGFSPELTHTATLILGTLTNYLSHCLGPARPVAVPTPQHLADLATSLTYLTNTFHNSLRQVVEHAAPCDTTGLDEAHVAALHHSLVQASEALRRAAQNLALASYHAAGLHPSQDRP
jgi:hypothetical protein